MRLMLTAICVGGLLLEVPVRGEAAETTREAAGPDFRVSAVLGSDQAPMLGIVTKDLEERLVRVGDLLPGGFRVIEVDMESQKAVFERDGRYFESYLRGDASLREVNQPPPAAEAPQVEQSPESADVQAPTQPASGSPLRLQSEDGEQTMNIAPLPDQPEYALVETDDKTYVIPSRAVEGLLRTDFESEEQRMAALMGYPLLTEYDPEQDVEQVMGARARQLRETRGSPRDLSDQ